MQLSEDLLNEIYYYEIDFDSWNSKHVLTIYLKDKNFLGLRKKIKIKYRPTLVHLEDGESKWTACHNLEEDINLISRHLDLRKFDSSKVTER